MWLAEEELLVGTLDGNIFQWRLREPQPQVALQLEGSVICMHVSCQQKVRTQLVCFIVTPTSLFSN